MTSVRVQEAASHRIDEIYRYTRNHWGNDQAKVYISGLFKAFSRIAAHQVLSHPIPAEFEVAGFYFRYEKHFVYWKILNNGDIGIVTVLHERMHQMDRFREDLRED